MEEQTEVKSGGNNMLLIGGIVIAVLLIGGVAVYAKSSAPSPTPAVALATSTPVPSPTASPTPTTVATASAMPAATTTATGVKIFNLEAGSFYYKPNEIKVKKGEKVRIVMSAKDMMHDFNIDELKVKLPITKSGETGTVEFTADKVGSFEFYCSVGQHRKNGQVGKLIVE